MTFADDVQRIINELRSKEIQIRAVSLQEAYLSMEGLVRAMDREPVANFFGSNTQAREMYTSALSAQGAMPILARKTERNQWQLEIAVCIHNVTLEILQTLEKMSESEAVTNNYINTLTFRDGNTISIILYEVFERILNSRINYRSDAVRLVLLPINQYLEIVKNDLANDPRKRTIFLQGIDENSTAVESMTAILKYAMGHNVSDILVRPDPFIDEDAVIEVSSLEDLEAITKEAEKKPIRGGDIRYCRFGVWQTSDSFLTVDNIRKLVALIKLSCDMDIAEHGIPQDGRLKFSSEDYKRMPELKKYEFRVNVMRTVHGENAVIRLLPKTLTNQRLDDLGFRPRQLEKIKERIHEPHGMVLATGPTGSGKTTTLYSCIDEVKDTVGHVVTAEDPVEKVMPGLTQVQINLATGMTYDLFNAAVLRQRPNLIFIGEMRDKITLETAIRAAITGHLVFSSIHVDCSLDVPLRLKNMGAEGVYVASSLLMVISQRLIRRLCPHCCRPHPKGKEELEKYLGVGAIKLPLENMMQTVTGRPCQCCNGTGYYGMVLTPEVWTPSSAEKEAISAGSLDFDTFLRLAIANGFEPMAFQAFGSVLRGETDMAEVMRGSIKSDELVIYHDKLIEFVNRELQEMADSKKMKDPNNK